MTRKSEKYIPPHARQRRSSSLSSCPLTHNSSSATTFGETRAVFFGDSFIRLFGLVKHPSLTVKPFPGATAKGLTRAGNENRLAISRIVNARANKTDRWVFCFGSVDVNLLYYHKKFQLNEGEIGWEEIAENYVDFVASLPFGERSRTTIVGIYPSPIEDQDVAGTLFKYGYIENLQMNRVMQSDDILLHNRQERIRAFNNALRAQCQKHDNFEYADVFDAMIDDNTMKIRKLYRDVKDRNIHVVWETTILLWLQKWEWLRKMAPPTLKQKLAESMKQYLGRTILERKHPSQL